MSSDSLTPPPLSSPNKLSRARQIDAALSPRTTSSSISAFASTSTLTYRSVHDEINTSNGSRRTSQSSKRSRGAREAVAEPSKRVRSGTPIELNVELDRAVSVDEELEFGDIEVEHSRAGPSNYVVDGYTLGESIQVETSDAGEGGDSVLFSEQVDTQNSTIAPGSTSTAIQGNMADYLPQPDVIVAGTEETEDLGEYREDGDETLREDQGEEEGDDDAEEEDDHLDEELDESHDKQDGGDEEDEDGAETPQWLTEPHMLVQQPVDRMSRVLERNTKITKGHVTSEATEKPSEGFEEEHHRRTDGTEIDDGEEQWETEKLMSPQSYHSGDTDDYEMSHRPVLERTAIKKDIRKFADNLECMKDPETGEFAYRIVDRLGEGELIQV